MELKLRVGSYRYRVTFTDIGEQFEVRFPYAKALVEEIKVMQGARWCPGDDPHWKIKKSQRNLFQLNRLTEQNPYRNYDKPLIEWNSEWETELDKKKPLYQHQKDMVLASLTYHYVILAAEMGTGKTRAAIKTIDIVRRDHTLTSNNVWWVGPKSAIAQAQIEFWLWQSPIFPRLFTYEGLIKELKDWQGGDPPIMLIVDEASRVRNYTTKRAQAVQYLSDCIRDKYKDQGYVIQMSGSPAPKDPVDWWSLCEIACPGFLREGDPVKFKKRLAVIEYRESITGASYPHLLGWKDDENRCNVCGKMKDDPCHTDTQELFGSGSSFHKFIVGENEIGKLYSRMKGLVTVKFKKDCLDLPDKQYRVIRLKPTQTILNALSLIEANSTRAIQALTLARELSDGFQYQDEIVPGKMESCPVCLRLGHICEWEYVGPDEQYEEAYDKINLLQDYEKYPQWFQSVINKCNKCKGGGEVQAYVRGIHEVATPKEDALKILLEEQEDSGRIVIFAGFTGSIDRICRIVKEEGWKIIRVDGRGWHNTYHLLGESLTSAQMLQDFQQDPDPVTFERKVEKLAFIGHPESGGIGVTLTKSSVIVYWSNDFKAENRIQSEDRIHRPGMDVNKGATIIDLIHLPTDQLIMDNLKKKRDLQAMTMGKLKNDLQNYTIKEEELWKV